MNSSDKTTKGQFSLVKGIWSCIEKQPDIQKWPRKKSNTTQSHLKCQK